MAENTAPSLLIQNNSHHRENPQAEPTGETIPGLLIETENAIAQGLTHKELAAKLNLSKNTVRGWINDQKRTETPSSVNTREKGWIDIPPHRWDGKQWFPITHS